MHRIQEVVRLHRLGQSQRAMAQQLRMGRETIRIYEGKLREVGLLDGSAHELPESAVLKRVIGEGERPDEETAQTPSSVQEWRPKISELHDKGCGPTAIHDHLRLHEPDDSGSLSAVKRMCRRLKAEAGPMAEDVAIGVETVPGEVAQVDFGYAGLRYDPERGILRKCWVFVMTLGFSRDVFCDLVFDQKIGTWLDLHVRAFEYFGGVPEVLVPDNLKSAVIRASFSVDVDPALRGGGAGSVGLAADPLGSGPVEKVDGPSRQSCPGRRRFLLRTLEIPRTKALGSVYFTLRDDLARRRARSHTRQSPTRDAPDGR
jgi:hypothetical protein